MTGQQTSTPASKFGNSDLLRHVKYEHLVAGISGGVCATLTLHPLDLVKVRFQGKLKQL